jgi:hypothetical protein
MKKTLLILSLFITAKLFGQAVPNGTFESWSLTPYEEPNGIWYTSNPQSLAQFDSANVTKVIGFSGQAVHLRTIVTPGDTDFAYIKNTPGDPTKAQGGVPYTQMSTSITGYYRYDLVPGDTALLLVLFKKNGAVIGRYGAKIFGTLTGSFSLFNFPFVPALSTAPDTMIIASASSNAILSKTIKGGSWLELDQLAFTGPNTAISGGTFDSWSSLSYDVPVGWNDVFTAQTASGVSQTTAKYAGSYAVSLQSQPGNGPNGVAPAIITTGQAPPKGNTHGGRPYTLTKDTLMGYYFYNTPGTDSGVINITLTKNGGVVGGGGMRLKAVGFYTFFKIPIAAGSTPDTMKVDVLSSVGSSNANSASALVVDNLSLKSQPLGLFELGSGNTEIKTFPNPAKDKLNIELSNNISGAAHIYVYDITGRIIKESDITIERNHLIQLNVEGLNTGMYFYKLNTENGSFENKFVKE